MKRIVTIVFWASLAAFLAVGAVVVFGQMLGVVINRGSLVAGVSHHFAKLAFSLSTLCSAAAFVLGYFRRDETPRDPQ